MLLTLYYAAATWIQSWRLSSLSKRISELLSHNASIVMYRVCEPSANEGGITIHVPSLSSSSCLNCHEAKIEDLLWTIGERRVCSVFPRQKVNLLRWVNFLAEKPLFPMKIQGESKLSDTCKFHVLIEAEYLDAQKLSRENYCQVCEFGNLKAWRAREYFGLILETDIEHFAKLGLGFMLSKLCIEGGMEVVRIESVELEGYPCVIRNTDDFPFNRISGRNSVSVGSLERLTSVPSSTSPTWLMSPSQWLSHVDLLQTISVAAERAVSTDGGFEITADMISTIKLSAASSVESLSVSKADSKVNLLKSVQEVPTGEKSPKETESPKVNTGASPIHRNSQHLKKESPKLSIGDEQFDGERERSSDSIGSLGSASTASAGSVVKAPLSKTSAGSITSMIKPISRAAIKTLKMPMMKPPNVLIYSSESGEALENVTSVMQSTLDRYKYLVYSINTERIMTTPWQDNACLLVIAGSIPDSLAQSFISYLLSGGKILCICSDFLHLVLPTFRTAEVRENELVRFSYKNWKNVRLMHHIFCYIDSPRKQKFSHDIVDAKGPTDLKDRSPAPKAPSSVEVKDVDNKSHRLEVKVLAAEETWQTPSLLMASAPNSPGKVVFSQIHLEVDPLQYESDDTTFAALKQNNMTRLEILKDLLTTHLDLECAESKYPDLTSAVLLGKHEDKLEFLSTIKSKLDSDSMLKMNRISLKFCGKGVDPPRPTETLLPILVHACPRKFSTVEYFESLKSETLGRLVIHAEVINTTTVVLDGPVLYHGLTIIPYQQTRAKGRGGNLWINPEGCAMFSMQLFIPSSSYLGQHPSILQHLVTLAVVLGVTSMPGYEALDLRLKWPNDIYYSDEAKLGGVLATSVFLEDKFVFNIGCAVNLSNSNPTTCINDLIRHYNTEYNQNLAIIPYEKLLARAFSCLEELIALAQGGNMDKVLELYYQCWLHSGADVIVKDLSGNTQHATIVGVDEYGFLKVQSRSGIITSLQPDGNSFDMMKGLVYPK